MSFPRYPNYKPSGVEWLGDVPEGWEPKPLRSVFKFSKGLTITKEDLQDEGVPCVNYGEVHSKYGFRLNPVIHPLRCVAPEYRRTNPDALICDGDFVFADTSEDLEGSGNFTHLRSEEPIFAGYHTIIGRPRKDISPLLLAYQIHSLAFRSQIQKQVKGVKVFSISQGILKAAKCVLPPLAEQTAIAEFLDRETGKIDELVAEQRRLMELLKEKRQAIISHAVTQGLNPHAPMKPSGIEWLGDVPAHWSAMRFRYLTKQIVDGAHFTPTYVDEGVPFLRVTDITSPYLNLDEVKRIPHSEHDELIKRCQPEKGDLLLSKNGTIGVPRVVDWEWPFSIFVSLCLIKLKPTLNAHFARYVFFSRTIEIQINEGSKQSTVVNLHLEKIAGFRFPVPPVKEQEAIVHYLDNKLIEFDTLTAEAQRAIDLLQERRTALISAAVTGQIDVRTPRTRRNFN